MADIRKIAGAHDSDRNSCDHAERGERGERGHRGHRGRRGHLGHDGSTGTTGPTGPTGPAGTGRSSILWSPNGGGDATTFAEVMAFVAASTIPAGFFAMKSSVDNHPSNIQGSQGLHQEATLPA